MWYIICTKLAVYQRYECSIASLLPIYESSVTMASVWKRLQRVNKRAAKFQFTASYHRIDLETTPKWKPTKLCVVWTRRSRRAVTEPRDWEPSLKDPLKGSVIYPVPENQTVTVTLFRDARTNEFEDKEWTFVLEDVSRTGKRRRLSSCALDLREYAALQSRTTLTLSLTPLSVKVKCASISLTLHSLLLREGNATDEDMQSLASLLSVNNNSDIAVLEDLDEDEFSMSDNSAKHVFDFRQQMEEMTNSLTNSDIAATPNSVQSLNFDNSTTPTAALTPTTPITPTYEIPQIIQREPERVEKFKNPFKTRHFSKQNLKPLQLTSNLNDFLDRNDNKKSPVQSPVEELTPIGGVDKLFPYKNNHDKTPMSELLWWCKSVTSEYGCEVKDLTNSWSTGLAFCAIVHHHRPDLIDYSALDPDDAEGNLRVAFEASAKLGVSQVLTAADILAKPVPDRLAIMTHLFQLRAHFTGEELQVEQLGTDPGESSYLVGRHDTDEEVPRDLFSREVAVRRSNRSFGPPINRLASPLSSSPILSARSPIIDKHLEPPPVRPEKLMTRKELTDPFGSDEEDEQEYVDAAKPELKSPRELVRSSKSPEKRATSIERSPELPKPPSRVLSRHDELKERARQLLEGVKRDVKAHENNITNGDTSPKKMMTEEDRQSALRERARKLIADARAGIVSPTSPSRASSARGGVEIISRQSVLEEIAAAGGVDQLESLLSRENTPSSRKSLSPDRSVGEASDDNKSVKSVESNKSPLHSFSSIVGDDVTGNGDEATESGSYIQSEMEALEREQGAVDVQAAALEKQLRRVMDTADDTQEEDRLMSQWFNLVNKKNALLRRQMQLNILEQEEDLSRRCELLARELRLSLAVDDWRKTPGQKKRERLLLQELLSAVNERDRLVQEMDEQEKAIADDDAIERNLTQVEFQRKNNCVIQ